ncbi:MAG: hypothetical protein LUB83_01985 [Prevotellaceae bacterium]|nr:hypothetical protein [Prevotellaceae bacterium]
MPYRRLPNTDQARIRALKTVLDKVDIYNMYNSLVSFETLRAAQNFLTKFEAAHSYYMECFGRQSKAGGKHHANVRTARLYISHFIQVLNLAAIRSEVRMSQKALYGLDVKSNTVPDLSTESALAEWGKRVIDGESKRTAQGGLPIYNPSIAKVKVHYDIFMESYGRQRNYQALTARSLEELAAMRAQADALILEIWNQVEAHFGQVLPLKKRLDLCREYGVVYYYRTGEKPLE